jgi:prevent-host-death family protein
VDTVEVGELGEHAGDLVRRAEAGETITVTFHGRDIAQLGPPRRHAWRHAEDPSAILGQLADTAWANDRRAVDNTLTDPFTR